MPPEERLGACQSLGCDEDVAPPPQDEWSAPLAPEPVADLVPNNGPQDAEHDGIAQVKVPPLDHDAGGEEYGLAGQRYPGALEHHPAEDDQVAVVVEEREGPVDRGSGGRCTNGAVAYWTECMEGIFCDLLGRAGVRRS